MTGGTVLVLGTTGRNFAAGMSGGAAYLLDADVARCNLDTVALEPVAEPADQATVVRLLERHLDADGQPAGGAAAGGGRGLPGPLPQGDAARPEAGARARGEPREAVAAGD